MAGSVDGWLPGARRIDPADLARARIARMSAAGETTSRPTVPGFDVLGRLGSGGMGVVWLARQESTGRLAALKLLPPHLAADPIARARLRRELEALAGCDDPHVVRLLDW